MSIETNWYSRSAAVVKYTDNMRNIRRRWLYYIQDSKVLRSRLVDVVVIPTTHIHIYTIMLSLLCFTMSSSPMRFCLSNALNKNAFPPFWIAYFNNLIIHNKNNTCTHKYLTHNPSLCMIYYIHTRVRCSGSLNLYAPIVIVFGGVSCTKWALAWVSSACTHTHMYTQHNYHTHVTQRHSF